MVLFILLFVFFMEDFISKKIIYKGFCFRAIMDLIVISYNINIIIKMILIIATS